MEDPNNVQSQKHGAGALLSFGSLAIKSEGRNMDRRFLLAPLILLGLIALAAGRAEAACSTSITGPCTITVAGTYNVNADFSTSGGASAITLNVPGPNPADVTINLDGHNITGSGGTGSGIGISGTSPQNNVAVIGPGLFTGFGGTGITVGTGTSAIVQGVTVVSSGTSTSVSSGGAGINVGDGSLVTGCIVESNGNTANKANIAGIGCGSGCSLSGNLVDSNVGSGIVLGADGSVINNSMSNNAQYGLNNTTSTNTGFGENVFDCNLGTCTGTSGCAVTDSPSMMNNVCNGSTPY